jgi:hypothetical protein
MSHFKRDYKMVDRKSRRDVMIIEIGCVKFDNPEGMTWFWDWEQDRLSLQA